jgi:hypothetical protein
MDTREALEEERRKVRNEVSFAVSTVRNGGPDHIDEWKAKLQEIETRLKSQ